jgi:Protein of unknown function (DUF1592)/Protein of unknown function (DUF1588)/Protein of unknown function (DUF1587)/Protein of unknown function (DUF1595)/Protein of unknown function (DUF1585)
MRASCWWLLAFVVTIALTMGALRAGVQSAPATISFSRTVYPIFEAAQCRGCHADDGVASATRLHFPDPNASPDEIEAFGLTLATLVNRADPFQSLLINKPTNRERHTGGVRIKPGSFDETALVEWVRYLAGVPDEAVNAARERLAAAAKAGASPDERLRRLTHSQYNNTVRDLLGDFSRPADRFPPEDFVNGFKNQLRTQGMPPLLAEAYSAAAEKLALNAFRAGDVHGLVPCKPASASDVRCRDQFVRGFGLRAFRRPLTDVEATRYAALFSEQATPGGKAGQFLDGARAVVEAMLQSPKFLFHVEAGPGHRSDAVSASPAEARPIRERAPAGDYEVASRLAYFLWDTMPDRRLLDAAANGELRSADGIERIARSMLDHPFARQAVDEFFGEWLRFDRALGSIKDRRRFPEFTPELAAMMVQETRMLLGHLVWDNANFMEAFTADYGFLNADLASLYAMPAPAGEFVLMKFPAQSHRAGLLGQASFLSSNAGPVETSPTARGIFVREQLLCQHVPNPPPGVNTQVPEPTPDRPLARRQRMQSHVENPTCASCHRLMDPIGFGLENYDALGRWRDSEAIEFESSGRSKAPARRVDLPIDGTGEIAGLANSAFSVPTQIGRLLSESRGCQECVVKQVFRYAFGRPETAADRETIRRAFTAFRDSGFRFKELLIALVRAPQFLDE